MALKMQVRGEGGAVLSPLVSLGGINPLLQGVDRERFPLLGHIDPYGETIFNSLQVRSLMKELSSWSPGIADIEVPVGQLVEYCKCVLADTHRYLWIFGD
ncbi:hypothetical protein [Streptomyces sp. t99]|uniref:hypothetical protein n=1 Tax=Streptomyces sp. t99 TaxID=1828172 RepID=UPI00117E980E|nr:hypothetical protein [Streptomyces sp. t99]